jgi:hypothetical protein
LPDVGITTAIYRKLKPKQDKFHGEWNYTIQPRA